ncbi:L-fuco-beta-pyranose dehydrogenase [Rubellimicrobium mesophilum DSM 19309]|uniref:L-fuco-beta-pyranose dehydrogenase n=2 Tax=Rubellimicrobium TaxID=295418 RepID=A0A017HTU6_9RHOB|nr:L-fuco-beta-pyranose dehydrogenase [Rubellimicrobium mesophilum DSM 19309]
MQLATGAMATRAHARTGLAFTELGLGTAPLANLYRAIPQEEARAVMDTAWDGGVRHFDTAPLYGLGMAETRLNPFLKDKPRDSYVLASKVGRWLKATSFEGREGHGKWFDVPSRVGVYDYSYDGVMRSLEFSLERLGVDRVDILHTHDLDVWTHGSQEALDGWIRQFVSGGHRALHELRSQGVIRAIGLGINEWETAQWLAERAELDVILLAGRYTLLEQGAAKSFLPVCEEKGIGVIIGGPYNSGLLAGHEFYNYDAVPPELALRTKRLKAVCESHGVSLIDAAFQFPLRHKAVVSVIPGSQTVAEMESNLRAARAEIPQALWDDLAAQGLIPAGRG